MNLRIGIDIGSTTVKVVVLDEQNNLLFRSYERHFSKVREKTCEILERIKDKLLGHQVRMVITGSAGLGVSKASGIDFVQEGTPLPPQWTPSSPAPMRSLSWAARTPRSSSSAALWKNA